MEQPNNNPRFPEQNEPNKIHGTTENAEQKEKYIRDSGKIEDLPEDEAVSKMNTEKNKTEKSKSEPLTDASGEEKKEDYINTDERKKDLDKRGL